MNNNNRQLIKHIWAPMDGTNVYVCGFLPSLSNPGDFCLMKS